MTAPTHPYERREDAMRAWGGARDALDGALARYWDPDSAAGLAPAQVRQQVRGALARATQALADLGQELTPRHAPDQGRGGHRAMSAERDALLAALVQEYAAVLARGGRDPNRVPDLEKLWYRRGGRDALRRVAERLGVTDLHARAAEVVACGQQEEDAP